MTTEQQQIAIAEACGWNVVKCPFVPNRIRHGPMTCFTDEAKEQWHKTYPTGGNIKSIPDYPNDLNAMHEAEKELKTGGSWQEYLKQAFKLAVPNFTFEELVNTNDAEEIACRCSYLLQLTAAQRAEAFLRTVGKWS